jgi:hypothetical protein
MTPTAHGCHNRTDSHSWRQLRKTGEQQEFDGCENDFDGTTKSELKCVLCDCSKGRSKSRKPKEPYKADGFHPQFGWRKLSQLVQSSRSGCYFIRGDEMCGEPPSNIRDRYAYKFAWWRYRHGQAFPVPLGDRPLLLTNV